MILSRPKKVGRKKSPRYKFSHPSVKKRTIQEATMLVDEDLTYDDLSRRFDVCVATIYKDIHLRLPGLDKDLYEKVCSVVQRHQLEAADRAVKARMSKHDYIKKNFDLSIFDK